MISPARLSTRRDHQLFLAVQDIHDPDAPARVLECAAAGASLIQAFPLAMNLASGRVNHPQLLHLTALEVMLATWHDQALTKVLQGLKNLDLAETVFPGLSALRQFRFEHETDVSPTIMGLRHWNSGSRVFRRSWSESPPALGLWEVLALRHRPEDNSPECAQAFALVSALETHGLDWSAEGPGPAALLAAVFNTKWFGSWAGPAPDLLSALLLSAPASWWALPARPLAQAEVDAPRIDGNPDLGDYLADLLGQAAPPQFRAHMRAQRLEGTLPAAASPRPRNTL